MAGAVGENAGSSAGKEVVVIDGDSDGAVGGASSSSGGASGASIAGVASSSDGIIDSEGPACSGDGAISGDGGRACRELPSTSWGSPPRCGAEDGAHSDREGAMAEPPSTVQVLEQEGVLRWVT